MPLRKSSLSMNPRHYSMVIQWDDEDNIYIVTVPELPGAKTHGKTHKEAIKNALEVIELWIEVAQQDGDAIPPPHTYEHQASTRDYY